MQLKTIQVKGKPFTYEDEIEDISYENIIPISEEDVRLLLARTKEIFTLIKLPFYLAFGTLLGAVRDNGVIPGDEDVDIFIDDEQTLYDNLPFLYEKGYRVCRITDGASYSFRVNHTSYIDVYILRPFKWYTMWGINCLSLDGLAVPRKFFKEYDSIYFLGDTYQCPKEPEKILRFWYGRNWHTPIRGHKFMYTTFLYYYWIRIVFHLRKIVKIGKHKNKSSH